MEIDHCPNCGGVWMDPGELDELIRREAAAALREGHEQLVRNRHNRPFDTQTFSTAVNPTVLVI